MLNELSYFCVFIEDFILCFLWMSVLLARRYEQRVSAVPWEVRRGGRVTWNWSFPCLSIVMWVLGIKPLSSAGVASVPTHGVISLAPNSTFFLLCIFFSSTSSDIFFQHGAFTYLTENKRKGLWSVLFSVMTVLTLEMEARKNKQHKYNDKTNPLWEWL